MLKTFYIEDNLEVGVDEAGAGCLAGPVVAAAVIWNNELNDESLKDPRYKLIKDSKKLNKRNRELARDFILENCIDYSIQSLDHSYIDKHNILNSRIDCMHLAINDIPLIPDLILVDGHKFKPFYSSGSLIPHQCIVKGDNEYISIAAASILAKTFRDDYMSNTLHTLYPHYDFHKNKGYGTSRHYDSIQKYGISPVHRLTFRLK